MNNHSDRHHRGSSLARVASWRWSTVPLAVALVVVQSFYVLFAQVHAADEAHTAAAAVVAQPVPLPAEPASPVPMAGAPTAALDTDLVSDDQRAAVMAEAEAAQFRFRPGPGGSVIGSNRNNRLDLAYDANGMRVTPERPVLDRLTNARGEPEWEVRFKAQTLAIDSETTDLRGGSAPPAYDEERLTSVLAAGCREWYVNRAAGLEHGFTIDDPGTAHPPSRVAVTVAVETALTPVLENGAVRFRNAHGNPVLIYRDLHVFDDTGRELPSVMSLQPAEGGGGARIILGADTAGAVFPITIDPVTATPDGVPMMAPTPASDEKFGFAAAGVDNWYVSAAPCDGNGVVHVHERDQGGSGQWGHHSTLEVPATENPGTADNFGFSVDIARDFSTGQYTMAVGAPDHAGCGAVFLFVLVATAWVFLQKIQPNDLLGGDQFGCDVSLWGTFLAVGAYLHGFNGAAYVFTLVLATWAFFQKVTVDSAGAGAQIGRAVAITIRNLLIGAPGENSGNGAAYLFTRALVAGALFTGTFFRLFSDKADASVAAAFGIAVAMTLTMIAIGSPGTDTNGISTLTDRGGVTLFAFFAATATWAFLTARFGSVAGCLMGQSVALNKDNDLGVGCPGSVAGALGGVILLYLFNALKFLQGNFFNSYDSPTTVSPPVTPDPGMQFGNAVVLIGTLLFVSAVAYSSSLGVVFRFLLTATALSFAAWQLLFFTQAMIDNPALQDKVGATGDYSGDGIPNIVKWAMGLLPIIFNANVMRGEVAANGYYLLALPVSLVALNAIYVIEYSTLLAGWFAINLGPLAAQFFYGFTELGITKHTFGVSIAVAAALILFFRVFAQEA